jgi:hypothetical protein
MRGNESSSSSENGKFLDQLCDYQHFKNFFSMKLLVEEVSVIIGPYNQNSFTIPVSKVLPYEVSQTSDEELVAEGRHKWAGTDEELVAEGRHKWAGTDVSRGTWHSSLYIRA